MVDSTDVDFIMGDSISVWMEVGAEDFQESLVARFPIHFQVDAKPLALGFSLKENPNMPTHTHMGYLVDGIIEWNEVWGAEFICDIIFSSPTSTKPSGAHKPDDYVLSTPYPNPFNPNMTLQYALLKRSDIEFVIYNIQGSKVWEMRESGSGA